MKKRAGFTLIEMLVTMALMTTVFSLVGPLIYNQIEKAETSSEYIEAKLFFYNSGRLAFLHGTAVELELDGKRITRNVNGVQQTFDFNYLFFPKQRLKFNANGFTEMSQVQVVAGRRELMILLDHEQSAD